MSALFLRILNMSLAASWLALAVLALRLCLRRAPKWVNVLLWGIVAVRLLFPFSIESTLSLIPRTQIIGPAAAASPARGEAAAVVGGAAVISGGETPLSIWTVLAWVWLAGVLALAVYAAGSALHLRQKVSTAVRLRGNVYQSEYIASPFVLGTINPKIYLPYHMGSRDRQHVIAHERAHLRRGDHVWKPLGFLLLTIHWFNPLLWLSYVLLCRDIELACDEKVIKDLGREQRADYMQALVSCSVDRRRIAACPLAFGEIGVKERVKSVMNYKKPTFWITLLAIVVCIALAVCFLTDPADPKTSDPSDAADSNTEITPDPAAAAPEEPAQTATPSEPAQPAEQDAPKENQSIAGDYDPVLETAIDEAVMAHYADSKQTGQYQAESHVILAKDESGDGTLTVYLLVLQQTYSVDGETLTVENGSYVPTAITFSLATSSGPALLEYWEPRDGSYYSDDIRAKFPADAAEEALNDQAYIDDLRAACEQAVRAAINGTEQ